MSATLLRAAFDSAAPELVAEVSKAKDAFVGAFGDFVHAAHRDRLNELFMAAGRSKLRSLFATSTEEAREQSEIFETRVDDLETIGLADWITAKSEIVKAMKASLRQILHGLAVGFGLAVKAVMGVVLPGLGAIGGAVAGPGVTYLLDTIFGSSPT